MNTYNGGGNHLGQQGLLSQYDSIVGAWVLEKSRCAVWFLSGFSLLRVYLLYSEYIYIYINIYCLTYVGCAPWVMCVTKRASNVGRLDGRVLTCFSECCCT